MLLERHRREILRSESRHNRRMPHSCLSFSLSLSPAVQLPLLLVVSEPRKGRPRVIFRKQEPRERERERKRERGSPPAPPSKEQRSSRSASHTPHAGRRRTSSRQAREARDPKHEHPSLSLGDRMRQERVCAALITRFPASLARLETQEPRRRESPLKQQLRDKSHPRRATLYVSSSSSNNNSVGAVQQEESQEASGSRGLSSGRRACIMHCMRQRDTRQRMPRDTRQATTAVFDDSF